MLSLDTKIPPPVVAVLTAAGMWAASGLGLEFALPSWSRYAAVSIIALMGVGFDLLGIFSFRASRTTINPLKPERTSTLVTEGVYRITRNPMYVGLALLLCAWAVYLSSLLPFAGPAIFILYITRFQIQPEERVLKSIFGETYTNYCARVRRWL